MGKMTFVRHLKTTGDPKASTQTSGDLFSNIKCLLVVGKFIFILPCQGLSWKNHHQFVFRRNSLPTAICLLIITWCFVKNIVGLKFLLKMSHGGVVGYAHPAHYVLISSVITFIYLYFFTQSEKLKELFKTWDKVAENYKMNVVGLRRVTLLAVLLMLLPFAVNSLFSIDGIVRLDGKVRLNPGNETQMEYVYKRLLQHWHSIIPFSDTFTVLSLLDFVLGSLPRSYVIAFVTVFSYALSRQFKDVFEEGLARVKRSEDEELHKIPEESHCEEKVFWISLMKKHNALTDLVGEFDSFLSPLIFVTYFTSLYLLCMQLLRALSSATGHTGAELTLGLSPFIYNVSFCVEVFLLYFMSIIAAQLNDYAHRIGTVLRRCPIECHTPEMSRLENRINHGSQIGFTGLRCFVITKPFLLTIANAVITLEIVLLQAQVTQPVFGLN